MGEKRGVRVAPTSKVKITKFAQDVRDSLGIERPYICPVRIIEGLQHMGELEVHVMEDGSPELYGKEAETFPDRQCMRIKQSVYDAAYSGDGRARFTIAHEIGHLYMHKGMQGYARGHQETTHKSYEDSEWQADFFAAELLMDSRYILPGWSEDDIQKVFVVSRKAAEIKYNKQRGNGFNPWGGNTPRTR